MFKDVAQVFATRRRHQTQRLDSPAEALQHRVIRGERVPVLSVPQLDRYMFDLQGYLVLPGAVSAEELEKINDFHDRNIDPGKVFGLSAQEARLMMEDPDNFDGKELQQGFGGPGGCKGIGGDPAFDCLIDHPSWIHHIRHFTNGDETVMTPGGGGVSHRWPGQASGAHGGGVRNGGFSWIDADEEKGEPGRFRCQVVSVLLALNDSLVGGGNTFVVPGSHRTNIRHPYQDPEAGHPQLLWRTEEPQPLRHGHQTAEGGFMNNFPAAIELTMQAGDALILCEACVHGSGVRTIPGARRFMVLRYGPDPDNAWQLPADCLARLGPGARSLVSPTPEATENARL